MVSFALVLSWDDLGFPSALFSHYPVKEELDAGLNIIDSCDG